MFFLFHLFLVSQVCKFCDWTPGLEDSEARLSVCSFTILYSERKTEENPGSFGFDGVLGAREGIGLKVWKVANGCKFNKFNCKVTKWQSDKMPLETLVLPVLSGLGTWAWFALIRIDSLGWGQGGYAVAWRDWTELSRSVVKTVKICEDLVPVSNVSLREFSVVDLWCLSWFMIVVLPDLVDFVLSRCCKLL